MLIGLQKWIFYKKLPQPATSIKMQFSASVTCWWDMKETNYGISIYKCICSCISMLLQLLKNTIEYLHTFGKYRKLVRFTRIVYCWISQKSKLLCIALEVVLWGFAEMHSKWAIFQTFEICKRSHILIGKKICISNRASHLTLTIWMLFTMITAFHLDVCRVTEFEKIICFA